MPQFKRDEDGGLTLLIQNKSPGKDKEANWLPAPKGPFRMYLRLYCSEGRSFGWDLDQAAVATRRVNTSPATV